MTGPDETSSNTRRRSRRAFIGTTGALGLAAIGGTSALAERSARLVAGGDYAPAVRISPPPPFAPPGSYQPGALFVALYGHPGSRTLGALGEQGPDAAVRRAQAVADPYRFFGQPVIPTFEVIATVAAADAGGDGDYSNEFPDSKFEPWISAAAASGIHIVLDLQSGRSRFPDQAREIAGLLAHPNVSLALDPEWRVATGRPIGGRIGSVDASEVNETIVILDAIAREGDLPPKMLIVHQFTPSMITNKRAIRGTDRIQVVIHMDGFGSLALKRGSYSRVVADLPDGALLGWKNFYDEDRPTPTAAQTMASTPRPMFVSYQ